MATTTPSTSTPAVPTPGPSSSGANSTSNLQSAPVLKRLKLVISDLHLCKGRQIVGGSNPLEEFFFGDKLIEFLEYYSSPAFRQYEIELIINGDFMNFLQVDYRGHFLTVLTESVCLEMLQSIVQGHTPVFEALKKFLQHPHRHLTYVIGNHDQHMLWPSCRDFFNQTVGYTVKFKNLVYFFDGVHIEHGHMQEAANRFDPRRFFLKRNLVEPILNLPFGSHFFIELVLKIKGKYPFVDKIRPFSRMVRWFFWNETWLTLKTVLHLSIYLIRTAFSDNPRRHVSVKNLLKIIYENAIFPDLSDAAKEILQQDHIHTVIFGHSHVYQYRQFAPNKEYFNTGTWTEITSLDVVSLGKITKLTFVSLEYPTEGEGPPRGILKEWRGYHRLEEELAVS